MIYILQNLVPILAATLAAFLFGGAWYMVFAKPWAHGTGRMDMHGKPIRPSIGSYAVTAIAEFWMISILAGALILAPVEAGVWTVTFGTAFILWVGFILPPLLSTDRLRRTAPVVTALDLGHWLGALLVAAAVLRLIGVEGPEA